MDQAVPARCPRCGDRGQHTLGNIMGRPDPAHPVADRDVDHLDKDAAEARDRLAGRGRGAERGLVREIEAVGAVDATRADLVRAEQHRMGARRRAARDERQRHIFEIGPRWREDDTGIVRHLIGGAYPPTHRLQPLRIGGCGRRRAKLGQHLLGPRISGGADIVGRGRGISQRGARPRRAVIAVQAGLGAQDEAGIAACGHQPGGIGFLNAYCHQTCCYLARASRGD